MIYYQTGREFKVLDNDQACFLPENVRIGSVLLEAGAFMFDTETIAYIRGYIGDTLKDKSFVDIGTNYGAYIMSLQDLFAHCYGFEPSKQIYNIACANMALHRISDKTTLYNCGLSDKCDMLKYTSVDEFGGCNFFVKEEETDTSVTLAHRMDGYRDDFRTSCYMQVNRLDDYNIKNIGLIKIDVEGFELNVLKGGQETLARNGYPMLIVESWNVEENDTDEIKEAKTKLRNELFEFVTDMGYKSRQIGYDNFLFIR